MPCLVTRFLDIKIRFKSKNETGFLKFYIDVIDVVNFRLTGFHLIGKALVKVSYLQNLRARLSMFRTELVEGAERRGEWADASWG